MAILAPVVFSILSVVVRLSAHRSQIPLSGLRFPHARKRRGVPHHAEGASPTLTIPESIAPPIGNNFYPNCAVHKKESLFVLYSALPDSQWWIYFNRTQPDYCPPINPAKGSDSAMAYRGSSPDPAIRLQSYLDPLWARYKCDAGLCVLWGESALNSSANNVSSDVLTLNRSIHLLEERLRNASWHDGDSSQYDPVRYDDYTKDHSPKKCNWLLPMDDRAIYLLSKNRHVLQSWGWRVASLDTEPAVMARLQNKALWGADAVARGLGHFVPKLYRSNAEAKFPCLLKHGAGMGGRGIIRIKDLQHLRRVLNSTIGKEEFEPNKDYVLQEVIPGPDEYTTSFVMRPAGKIQKAFTVLI